MPSYEIRKTLTTFASFYLTKCNPRGWMYFHMINFYRTHCTETNNTKIKQSIFNIEIKLFILQCHIVQLILKSWCYETMKYKYKATIYKTISSFVLFQFLYIFYPCKYTTNQKSKWFPAGNYPIFICFGIGIMCCIYFAFSVHFIFLFRCFRTQNVCRYMFHSLILWLKWLCRSLYCSLTFTSN